MFFPVYALLSSNAVVDPILYISTGSIDTVVTLNVLTGGTEYLIGNNISNVPLSVSVDTEYLIGNNISNVPLSVGVDTEYLIGNNIAEPEVSFSVDTEYVIANNTADVPITIEPGIYGQEFTTPGTYSWTAPVGVTSVSAVAVGGGGGGSIGQLFGPNIAVGGGGGGLGWKNNIIVVPGQTYTVVVGVAGDRGPNPSNQPGSDGGDSYFINTGTVMGGGGLASGIGGAYVGDGGGLGGLGRGSGGGAGGYSGNGGNGETSWGFPLGSNDATDGAGGGGGGGGCSASTDAQQGGGGGGVGIRGQGASGLKGQSGGAVMQSVVGGDPQPLRGGRGGSDGTNAGGASNGGTRSSGNAGNYGGGGGGYGTGVSSNVLGGTGGTGAVRIIWGSQASFP